MVPNKTKTEPLLSYHCPWSQDEHAFQICHFGTLFQLFFSNFVIFSFALSSPLVSHFLWLVFFLGGGGGLWARITLVFFSHKDVMSPNLCLGILKMLRFCRSYNKQRAALLWLSPSFILGQTQKTAAWIHWK